MLAGTRTETTVWNQFLICRENLEARPVNSLVPFKHKLEDTRGTERRVETGNGRGQFPGAGRGHLRGNLQLHLLQLSSESPP